MLEDVRKYMRLGLEALSSQDSDETGGDRRARAQVVAEQLSTLAASFLDWSAEARTSLVKEIKDLVARQVQEMGLITQKDLESLQRRLDRLEERVPPTKRGANPTSTAKTRAKRATKTKSNRSSKASSRSKAARGPR